MPNSGSADVPTPVGQIFELVNRLLDAEVALEKSLGADTDAVMDSRGHAHLLRHAQIALQQSEHRFRTLIEKSTDVIALISADGTILYDSPAMTGVLGYEAKELIGQNVFRHFHSEDQTEALELFDKLRAAPRTSLQAVLRYQHKNGSYRLLEGTATNLLDEPGVKAVVLNYRDITERRQVEKTSRENEARYRTMLQGVEAGVIVHGQDARITAFNPKACELLGLTESQISAPRGSYPYWKRIRADGSPMPEKELPYQRAFATREPVRDVVVGVKRFTPAGFVWLLVNANPILSPEGEVNEVIVTFMDVTARIRAENALRENAKFTDDVLNSLSAHVLVLDDHGIIVAVNDAWRKFAQSKGAPSVDVIGQSYSLVFAQNVLRDNPAAAAQVDAGILAVGASRQTNFVFEFSCDVAQQRHWFRMRVSPLGGRLRGVVVAHDDVTQTKRAELSLATNEALLRLFIQHTPAAIAMLDTQMRYLQTSECWVRDYHLEGQEIIGKSHYEIFPDAPARWKNIHQRVLAGAVERCEEDCFPRSDGTTEWLQWEVRPWYREDGKVGGVILFTQIITARKQAEREIRFNEQRYRSLIEGTTAIIWDTPASGEFEVPQPRWTAFTGQSFEQLRGQGWLAAIHPDDRAKTLQVWSAAVADRTVYEVEHRLRKHDGTYRSMQVRAVPILGDDGEIFQWIGVHTDITARELIEENLRRSEALLRIAGRAARLGAWTVELPAARVVWSDEVCSIHDLPAGTEPTVSEAINFYTPQSREILRRAFSTCIEIGTPFDLELQLVTAKGRTIWVRSIGEAQRNSAGVVLRVQGAFQDITGRKSADEALLTSEKRFKALFDQAAVGVALVEADTGRFVQVNNRFSVIAGRSAEELEGLTFSMITHPLDRDRDLEPTQQILAGTIREFSREKRYVRKDNSEVWVNLTVSAMWAPNDRPDYFITVAEDITQKKKLEDQFRQAQKMEAVGTLAGGIAHDFNNILAAIMGNAGLAEMHLEGNSPVKEHLAQILKATNRATDLVRQILAFSRQQSLQRNPLQLRHVVAEAMKLLRSTIPSTVEFDLSLAADAPTVLADATQIHQIMMNLGTNAWYAMKNQNGRLQVSLERCVVDENVAPQAKLRPGLYARLSVGDNGSGMDAATVSRIFEPFFTTKPTGEGTGLGLSVVHGIMESHEGAITVYSNPGEGTLFHLYFPALGNEVFAVDTKTKSAPVGEGQRVLFVDDEELLTTLAQNAIVALGYKVEVTNQPAQALAWVQAEPDRFDLVLTDQTMPGMTGLILAEEIRKIRPLLPVILMTGYSVSLTAERLKAAGIQQLLAKPTTLTALGVAIHEVLTARKS